MEQVFSETPRFSKLRDLAYGIFNSSGRTTITGMITGAFQQFGDWSAYYRLFCKGNINIDKAFNTIFNKGVEVSIDSKYVVVHMDDTVIKKTGRKVPGTSWRRDPLGPPFHTNFMWGQRFIKLALSVPQQIGIGPSRAIPIKFAHCPSAKKPKANAPKEEHEAYKEEYKQKNLNVYGKKQIKELREHMNKSDMKDKELVLCVDGSYTNATILKSLPDNVSFIGRTRKDAKFSMPAINQTGNGRNKVYGDDLPTPEQIRQSDEYHWQKVDAWAAGKYHSFRVKIVEGFIWRKTGANQKYRLLVISPLGYRLSKKGKLMYRKPAYLLCTNFNISIQDTLQFYIWRWEIEVNIGEAKGLFGVGQAQVRNERSAMLVPAFINAIYSILLLSDIISEHNGNNLRIPRPKWYPHKKEKRKTTGDLINEMKAQLYCIGAGIHFSHFINIQNKSRSANIDLEPAIYSDFYSRA